MNIKVSLTIGLLVSCIMPSSLKSQPLGKERIDKLKKSVVRITIDGTHSGTGFVVANTAQKIVVLTCWHVIEPSLAKGSDGLLYEDKLLQAQFSNGESIKLRVANVLLQDKQQEKAKLFDYCILILAGAPKQTISNIPLARIETLTEGDEVYTCGYPLILPTQFISRGYVSTIGEDRIAQSTGISIKKYALIDMTMNKGNSGGPIIRIGKTPDEDRVIGIATFAITAASGFDLNLLRGWLDKTKEITLPTKDSSQNLNLVYSLEVLTECAMRTSNGISGAIAIDHFIDLIVGQ